MEGEVFSPTVKCSYNKSQVDISVISNAYTYGSIVNFPY